MIARPTTVPTRANDRHTQQNQQHDSAKALRSIHQRLRGRPQAESGLTQSTRGQGLDTCIVHFTSVIMLDHFRSIRSIRWVGMGPCGQRMAALHKGSIGETLRSIILLSIEHDLILHRPISRCIVVPRRPKHANTVSSNCMFAFVVCLPSVRFCCCVASLFACLLCGVHCCCCCARVSHWPSECRRVASPLTTAHNGSGDARIRPSPLDPLCTMAQRMCGHVRAPPPSLMCMIDNLNVPL